MNTLQSLALQPRSAAGRPAHPTRGPSRRWPLSLAVIAATLALAACQPGVLTIAQATVDGVPPATGAVSPDGDAAAARRGARLFSGEVPLSAHLRGHDHVLPPDALRCSNCHVKGPGPTPVAAPAASAPTGDPRVATSPRGEPHVALPPRLNRTQLMEPQRRRGGPASAYTRETFCQLLRTGVDPASVYAAQTMPVYRLSDADCAALWLYLVAPAQP